MAAEITFWFDFVSGYSYPAAERIDALAESHGRNVDWRCVSLPHVFKALGHPMPGSLAAKWRYAMIDWHRSCTIAGLPHADPETMPLDARLARQTFYQLKVENPGSANAFARAVFRVYWGEGRNVATVDQLAATGLSREVLESAANNAAARQQVIAATEAAVAAGVIGAPFFHVDGEPFWGFDRLDHIDWHLKQAAAY